MIRSSGSKMIYWLCVGALALKGAVVDLLAIVCPAMQYPRQEHYSVHSVRETLLWRYYGPTAEETYD